MNKNTNISKKNLLCYKNKHYKVMDKTIDK